MECFFKMGIIWSWYIIQKVQKVKSFLCNPATSSAFPYPPFASITLGILPEIPSSITYMQAYVHISVPYKHISIHLLHTFSFNKHIYDAYPYFAGTSSLFILFIGSIPPNGYTTYSTVADHLDSVQLWTITQCAMNFFIYIFWCTCVSLGI